jgi:hypothetical protein
LYIGDIRAAQNLDQLVINVQSTQLISLEY